MSSRRSTPTPWSTNRPDEFQRSTVAPCSGLPDGRALPTPFNLGHQDATVYGLRRLASQIAESDLVVTMDSGGEDRPEDVPRLLAPLLASRSFSPPHALARSDNAGICPRKPATLASGGRFRH